MIHRFTAGFRRRKAVVRRLLCKQKAYGVRHCQRSKVTVAGNEGGYFYGPLSTLHMGESKQTVTVNDG